MIIYGVLLALMSQFDRDFMLKALKGQTVAASLDPGSSDKNVEPEIESKYPAIDWLPPKQPSAV